MLDILVCLFLIAFGHTIIKWQKKFNYTEKKTLKILYLYHVLMGVMFCFYIQLNGGDAHAYWFGAQNYTWNEILLFSVGGSATKNMLFLNYFPANILGLSFFTGSMIYAHLGFIAWLYVFKILKENVPDYLVLSNIKILRIPVFPWILFLPNLHFWTSGIGKDTLLFLSIIFFMYSFSNVYKRLIPLIICVVISYFIRPHILIFLVAAAAVAIVLEGKMKLYQKVFLFGVMFGGFFAMFDYVMNFVQLDSLDMDSVSEYSENKIQGLSREQTTSAVDMTSYALPLKIFTFLYRPLFFDLGGFLSFIASVENLFLLLFTYKVLRSGPIKAFKESSKLIKTSVIFFVVGSVSFSLILGNLGIMLRQKTPFILCFIFFGFWVLSYKLKLRNKNILLREDLALHK